MSEEAIKEAICNSTAWQELYVDDILGGEILT
jgi:hypothetical protein